MPNLSQIKRERMLAFLQKIKDEHKDDDDMLIALGEIESELTSKKYGLVWEQHEEAVDVMMRDYIPVFTEVPEREITAAPGQGYNFILEGDNLHSLRLLEKTHKGRIDVIYIEMKAPKLIQINYSSAVLPRGYIFGKRVHFAGRVNPGCFCFMEVAA